MIKYCILIIPVLIMISSCNTIKYSGHFVSDTDIEDINNIKPTKSYLVTLIGSASYIPSSDPNVWYYSYRKLNESFSKNIILEQRILKVTFEENKVSNALLVVDGYNDDIVIEGYEKLNKNNLLRTYFKNLQIFSRKEKYEKKYNLPIQFAPSPLHYNLHKN
ncbi:outer membrane protein assembly factor BamE [Rickettsia endosymbiont of Cardiosporidium cionae]|nr:outer membrane protein assembly factor BamE [Rickettsia endosymbiont of Cardiosporidium cionae]